MREAHPLTRSLVSLFGRFDPGDTPTKEDLLSVLASGTQAENAEELRAWLERPGFRLPSGFRISDYPEDRYEAAAQLLAEESLPHHSAVNRIAVSSDGRWMASADLDMRLNLWRDGVSMHSLDLTSASAKARAIQHVRKLGFLSDGRLAVALADRLLMVDPESGEPLWAYHPKAMWGFLIQGAADFVIRPDDRLVVGFDNGCLSLWNSDGWCERRRLLSQGPRMLAPLSDGRFLGSDGTVAKVYSVDLEPGRQIFDGPRVYALASTPDASRVAVHGREDLWILDPEGEAEAVRAPIPPGLPVVEGVPGGFVVATERGICFVALDGSVSNEFEVATARTTALHFAPHSMELSIGRRDGSVQKSDAGWLNEMPALR